MNVEFVLRSSAGGVCTSASSCPIDNAGANTLSDPSGLGCSADGPTGVTAPSYWASPACTSNSFGASSTNPTQCNPADSWGSVSTQCKIPGAGWPSFPWTLPLTNACDNKVITLDLVGVIYIFKDYSDILYFTNPTQYPQYINMLAADSLSGFDRRLWSCFTYQVDLKSVCNPTTAEYRSVDYSAPSLVVQPLFTVTKFSLSPGCQPSDYTAANVPTALAQSNTPSGTVGNINTTNVIGSTSMTLVSTACGCADVNTVSPTSFALSSGSASPTNLAAFPAANPIPNVGSSYDNNLHSGDNQAGTMQLVKENLCNRFQLQVQTALLRLQLPPRVDQAYVLPSGQAAYNGSQMSALHSAGSYMLSDAFINGTNTFCGSAYVFRGPNNGNVLASFNSTTLPGLNTRV
ncbi:uncharacterized protein HaLaN_02789 [Haematococcus lacustris]|uniref:Uncharacterized protein n=1 Tax=Haematococcus lacustris TaxID=44745 RepID=A0A699YXY6_HAELA|nr:uncharacterized protein HaLaN_02789 [Haematococcus lacustris]